MRSSHDYKAARTILFGTYPPQFLGDGRFRTKSQSEPGKFYEQNVDEGWCQCVRFTLNGTCKHLIAASMRLATMVVEHGPDAIKMPGPHWTAPPPFYTVMKEREPRVVAELARCLGKELEYTKRTTRGRPFLAVGNTLVCALLAGYRNKGSRTALPDRIDLIRKDFFQEDKSPSPNGWLLHLRQPWMTPIMYRRLRRTLDAVKGTDTIFAVDSVTMDMPSSELVVQKMRGNVAALLRMRTIKLHVIVGIPSMMIYAVVVTDPDTHDGAVFTDLFDQLVKIAHPEIVLGDAAYSWDDNYNIVHAWGATGYFDFKEVKMKFGRDLPMPSPREAAHRLWERRNQGSGWYDMYRLRPLVEAVFHSIKTGIKRGIRARTEIGAANELLSLCIVHNLKFIALGWKARNYEIPFADMAAMDVLRGIDQIA